MAQRHLKSKTSTTSKKEEGIEMEVFSSTVTTKDEEMTQASTMTSTTARRCKRCHTDLDPPSLQESSTGKYLIGSAEAQMLETKQTLAIKGMVQQKQVTMQRQQLQATKPLVDLVHSAHEEVHCAGEDQHGCSQSSLGHLQQHRLARAGRVVHHQPFSVVQQQELVHQVTQQWQKGL